MPCTMFLSSLRESELRCHLRRYLAPWLETNVRAGRTLPMDGQISRIETYCDASPYGVVRACEGCGFQSPLDVPWCRLSLFLSGTERRKRKLSIPLWQWLFGRTKPKVISCTCGQPVPKLKKYCFTFLSIKVGDYHLGQCRRCRTMFWDESYVTSSLDSKEGVAR